MDEVCGEVVEEGSESAAVEHEVDASAEMDGDAFDRAGFVVGKVEPKGAAVGLEGGGGDGGDFPAAGSLARELVGEATVHADDVGVGDRDQSAGLRNSGGWQGQSSGRWRVGISFPRENLFVREEGLGKKAVDGETGTSARMRVREREAVLRADD